MSMLMDLIGRSRAPRAARAARPAPPPQPLPSLVVPRAPVSDDYTDLARHSGRVVRYHTWAVHHHQTVGEHSWQVARTYAEIWGYPSREVAAYIQHHDTAELVVGDPPFPVKRDDADLAVAYRRLEEKALERLRVVIPHILPEEQARVKVCDLLEMMQTGMQEREMGNLLAVPIVLRTEQAARDVARAKLKAPDLDKIDAYCGELWLRHDRVLRAGDINHKYNSRWRRDQASTGV